jgi:hypothetical protein
MDKVLIATALIIILNCVPSPSSLKPTIILPNHNIINSNILPTIYQAYAIIPAIIMFATIIPTTTLSICPVKKLSYAEKYKFHTEKLELTPLPPSTHELIIPANVNVGFGLAR